MDDLKMAREMEADHSRRLAEEFSRTTDILKSLASEDDQPPPRKQCGELARFFRYWIQQWRNRANH